LNPGRRLHAPSRVCLRYRRAIPRRPRDLHRDWPPMNQHSEVAGCIRWSADIFNDPPRAPTARARPWILVALGSGMLIVTLIGVLSVLLSRSNHGSALAQFEITTGPLSSVEPRTQPRIGRGRPRAVPVAYASVSGANEIGSLILDQDFVIGVEAEGAARAYPLNMMGRPETELLNDTLGGRPIAATFCNTCQSVLIFSREVGGEPLTFFLSGELTKDNMVMQDAETGSKWAQYTGEAIAGPLEGQKLEQLAATWTDWKTWREAHPTTTALKLPRAVENYQHDATYSHFPPERAFFSRLQWGLTLGNRSRSWPYAQLTHVPLVNDRFADRPILIIFDEVTSTPTAFERRVDDLELTFERSADGIRDDETHSLWDPFTGRSLSGRMKGRQLRPLAGTISLQWAWRNFFPKSEIWTAAQP
jgi:Protein of unknown function (DUF3179)